MEADFQQYYNLNLWVELSTGGLKRMIRLLWQLPKDSRFFTAVDPMIAWDWRDLYLMQMDWSLRKLMWSKTKDAERDSPQDRPELVAPEFIHKAIREAEKKKNQENAKLRTPDAKVMTIEELDDYLKKPRKKMAG